MNCRNFITIYRCEGAVIKQNVAEEYRVCPNASPEERVTEAFPAPQNIYLVEERPLWVSKQDIAQG